MTDEQTVNHEDLFYSSEGIYLHKGEAFSGVAVEYSSAGSKVSDVHFSNGKMNGQCRTWHANGRPWSEGVFDNGVQEGIFRQWRDDGTLECEIVFHQGVRLKETFYDLNGNPIERSPSQ